MVMSVLAPCLRAEEPPAGVSPASSAQDLFDRALARRERGEAREACELFEASVAATPSPHGWLQVGNCREPSDPVAALEAFEAAAVLAARVDDEMRRNAYLNAVSTRIEPLVRRLPTLSVHAPSTPGMLAEVTLAGRELASPVDRYDEPLRFNPGRYQIRAWAPGFASHVLDLELLEGERRIITLPALQPLPEASTAEVAPAEAVPFAPDAVAPSVVDARPGPVIRPLPVLLSGGGLLLVLSGVVVGQLSTSERHALERGCEASEASSGQRRCSSDLAGAKQRMENLAIAADTLWIGGALLSAAGIGLFILDQNRDDAARVAAGCVPSHCGLSVAGHF
jgi:hypothetical protein